MRALNLLPWRQRRQARVRFLYSVLLATAWALTPVPALLVYLDGTGDLHRLQQSGDVLRDLVAQHNEGLVRLRTLDEGHHHGMEIWEQYDAQSRRWQALADILSDREQPVALRLSQVTMNQDSLELIGSLAVPASLGALTHWLQSRFQADAAQPRLRSQGDAYHYALQLNWAGSTP